MKRLKVLVAFEESQRVCSAFRELGHEAFSSDIKAPSGGHEEWHVQGDVRPLLRGARDFTTMDGTSHHVERFDLIVAHPPCTYFSVAGACHLFRSGIINLQRYNEGLPFRDLFFDALNSASDHVLVENPTPMKIWELPPCTQVIQPWQFGDHYTKRTCLWLKGLPNLMPEVLEKPTDCKPWVNAGSFDYLKRRIKSVGVANSAEERSKTFPGIARAIAKQCSYFLLGDDEADNK